MLSRSVLRAANPAALVARRGFTSTPVRLGSPYHYPAGPRSNIPFNPMTKFFWLRYTLFCATGFGTPFAMAWWQLNKNQ